MFIFIDWITDDLLKKLEGRPDLLKKLSDPRYSQALNQFTSNPQQGLQQLSNDKELQDFIKELCGVLGDHFTAMAEQENVQQYSLFISLCSFILYRGCCPYLYTSTFGIFC